MLGINLKRSVAALAVTARLLAAAAPASYGYSWGISQTGTAGIAAPEPAHGGHDTLVGSGPGAGSIWNNGDGNDTKTKRRVTASEVPTHPQGSCPTATML